MRRLLAILILLATGLPLATPLLASAEAASKLPACCRRNGAHHCEKGMEAAGRVLLHGSHFSAPPMRCAEFPKEVSPLYGHEIATPVAALVYAGAMAHPASFAQVEAWARVSMECARHKRGPPAEALA